MMKPGSLEAVAARHSTRAYELTMAQKHIGLAQLFLANGDDAKLLRALRAIVKTLDKQRASQMRKRAEP